MNDEQAELIPVRALNQVSYCPRLYYLEYVESVMPINEYVEDGLFQHRRINAPELANRTRKEGDVLRTRSVSLSSERLGITAKLDVLEEQEGVIRPVESKRSDAPRDRDGRPSCWENDAIQLCGQGLLIEEAFGTTVTTSCPLSVLLVPRPSTSRTVPPSFRWTFSAMRNSCRPSPPGETQPDPFHSPTQRSNLFIASSRAAGGVGAWL
jgi:CRISPR-associated protein Cas1